MTLWKENYFSRNITRGYAVRIRMSSVETCKPMERQIIPTYIQLLLNQHPNAAELIYLPPLRPAKVNTLLSEKNEENQNVRSG